MELQDFISSKNISLYMQQLPVETSIDHQLFPDDKTLSTKIEFAKGSQNKTVAVRLSKLDAATQLRALEAQINIETREMPYFKEGIGMNETTRRQIIDYMNSNNPTLVEALVKQVFKGYIDLIKGCEVDAKVMRCQAIQHGYVALRTVDGDVLLDYKVPANHKCELTGEDKWNNENADIFNDTDRFQKIIKADQYALPNTLLMTKNTFENTFMKNKMITDHLRSNIQAKSLILTEDDYLEFAKRKMKINIVFLGDDLVEETYLPYKGAEPVPYYEDGYITFMSGTTLGRTLYGYTPEEYDKFVSGSGKLDTTMYGNIAITTTVKEDPISIDTKVSQMVIPSFDRVDECFFLKCY